MNDLMKVKIFLEEMIDEDFQPNGNHNLAGNYDYSYECGEEEGEQNAYSEVLELVNALLKQSEEK